MVWLPLPTLIAQWPDVTSMVIMPGPAMVYEGPAFKLIVLTETGVSTVTTRLLLITGPKLAVWLTAFGAAPVDQFDGADQFPPASKFQ